MIFFFFFFYVISVLGSRGGAMLCALTSDPSSIPRLGVTCGVSLLVLYSAPKRFCPGEFTICQQKPNIPIGNSNGTAHSTGKFPKKMEIFRRIPLFPFQPK